MSHTPGPWINDASHPEWERNVVWAGDVVVARVVDDQHGNADANARLIAAAPELLASLKAAKNELIDLYEAAYPDDESDNDTTAVIDRVIAAIEAAEGRSE